MEALRLALTHWLPHHTLATRLPLEPDEPDVVWAYRLMRTEGMSLSQAISELIRSVDEPAQLYEHNILTYLAKPVVPALIATPTDPDSSGCQKGVSLSILTELKAAEAASTFLQILR